jgi:hypothetical protein
MSAQDRHNRKPFQFLMLASFQGRSSAFHCPDIHDPYPLSTERRARDEGMRCQSTPWWWSE